MKDVQYIPKDYEQVDAMTYKIKVDGSALGEECFIDNCPGSHRWRWADFGEELDVSDQEETMFLAN